MRSFDRSRDPNGASFYVLRYPADFGRGGGEGDPFRSESSPFLSAELFHDAERQVTELRPADPRVDIRPPPAIAVEPGGDVFLVNREKVLVRRFYDGSEQPFPCEPDLLRQPSGLALDRRGWLYVADPAAGRVAVLDTRTGAAINILSAGGKPVDVAVSPSGFVFVADNTGRILRFSPMLRPIGSFVPRNASDLPVLPRPVAVMIDERKRILVADARYPRLLRFDHDGAALGDAELSAVASGLVSATEALDSRQAWYGQRRFVFLAAPGCDCPPGDAYERLVEVHLAIRVRGLSLARTFCRLGSFTSQRLDGGAPGVQWHKVVIDAELPLGTGVTVETATSERPDETPEVWDAPRDRSGLPIAFKEDLPDQLVQSKPGRYLWLRMTLTSNGKATPSVRAIRVFYPRNSPLAQLPAYWQRDEETQRFLRHFLALVERINTGIESTFEAFVRDLHPDAAPKELVDWLAALIDLSFDPSWPLERRRRLLAAAMELYRLRGTPAGIKRYVQIYTGAEPVVLESFLSRPGRPPYLGIPGLVLGCNLHLCECAPNEAPEVELYNRYAHRFTVVVPLPDHCDAEVMRAVTEKIVEVNKPAHTEHRVEFAPPEARVGLRDRVGIDLVIGSPASTNLQLAGDPQTNPGSGSILGGDSALADQGTGYLGGTFGRLGGEL